MTLCACGEPLHYKDPELQKIIENLVKTMGETITVKCAGQKYKVQRHYIALHGIKANDLTRLMESGIIEKTV